MKLAREFRQQRLHAIEQFKNGEAADEERRDDPRKARPAALQLGAHRPVIANSATTDAR